MELPERQPAGGLSHKQPAAGGHLSMSNGTDEPIWRLHVGDGPLVATAIHDGHEVRDEVAERLALDDTARLREEDPFTGNWTRIAGTHVVGTRSRFEVDLNRPREKAVYRTPEDAWGLGVWKDQPPDEMFARSLAEYDSFYAAMRKLLTQIERAHGRFVVLDLHSYNHRRQGPDGPPADEQGNPQVNVGTGTMNRDRWAPVVDAFVGTLRSFDFLGSSLDVRENVKFFGGNWAKWVHESFPESGVVLAIEFKKFFMDEWTGEPREGYLEAIEEALRFTIPAVLDALKRA
jgi:N-formylglutamate deformylase